MISKACILHSFPSCKVMLKANCRTHYGVTTQLNSSECNTYTLGPSVLFVCEINCTKKSTAFIFPHFVCDCTSGNKTANIPPSYRAVRYYMFIVFACHIQYGLYFYFGAG